MYLNKSNTTEEITVALAHEVKNPVSLIKANIELLELDECFEGHQKNIKVIKRELNKISTIVTDFISFCKETNIKEITRINILYLVKDMIESLLISSDIKNIKFYFNCFCELEEVSILAEYSKISMLFSNIYKNALEAINHKEGAIITNIYTKNGKLTIDIIDNGEGLKGDIKNNVYEPFVTNKDGGSGLGMSICKNIMEEINGEFSIANNERSGCTAKLVFN